MSTQTLWDQMDHRTRKVALHILHDAGANKLAKDIARCVLTDNGARRLPCEDRYDDKVVPVDLIATIFRSVFPEFNMGNFDADLLAEWWVTHVRTDRTLLSATQYPPPATR